MAVLKLGRNDLRAVALTLAVCACLAGAVLLEAALPQLSVPLPGEDVTTLNSRTELWAKAFEHVAERPLVGYGFYASRYLLMRDFEWGGHAHNTFLEVLLTTGLIGLSILCAFVLHLCRACLETRDCLLLGVVVYCLTQGVLNPLLFSPVLPMFVMMVAVTGARLRAGAGGVG
jgi:O-antigen ligase